MSNGQHAQFNQYTHKSACTICGGDYLDYHTLKYTAAGTQHTATCSDCGYSFSESHDLPDTWYVNPSNSAQHMRRCTKCNAGDRQGHTWGSWVCNDDGTHTRTCTANGCGATETAKCSYVWQEASTPGYHVQYCTTCGDYSNTGKHSGGTATCTEKAVCTTCGMSYGSATGHDWSSWVANGDSFHKRTCQNDGCDAEECLDHDYGNFIYNGPSLTSYNHYLYCPTCGQKNYSWCTNYLSDWVATGATQHTCTCSICGGKPVENHNWSDWTRVDGDNHQRTCTDCGYVQTEAHTGGTATCLTPKICTVCNTPYGEANGHGDVYNVIIDQPTCTNPGTVEIRCEVCHMLITTIHPGAAHEPKMTTIVEATCCEAGYSQLICNNCQQAVNNGQHYPIAATGLHAEDWRETTAATCTTSGVETLYCGNSGKLLGDTRDTAKLGHDMTGDPVVTPATCTAEGSSVKTCQRPGCTHSETTILPIVDHVEGDPVTDPEPTCCNEGLKSWYCVNCNTLLRTEKLPAKGHGEGEYKWVTVSEPTCTEEGLEKKVCAHSGKDLGETREIPELGHDMTGDPVVTPATCTTEGKSVKTCQRNGCNYSETTILPIVDHVEGDPVTDPEPTCCNEGLKSWYCVNCNKLLRTEKLPAKGHGEGEYKWVTVSEPTCTEEGLEKKVCAHSGKDLGDTRSTDPLGHLMGEPVVTPATCIAEGKSVATCQRPGCTYSETETLPMVDHVEGEPVDDPKPTCCEPGLRSWYCDKCNTLLRTEVLPALGHKDGEYMWVTTKEPTCTEEGLEKKVCAHSGKDLGETRTIPALGHIYVGLWEVGESDTHHRDCYRCGAGRRNVECTYLPLIIDDVEYQVCPVCGRFHNQKLEVVAEADITIVTGSKPGVSLVRMLADPFGADEIRYPAIMTAIFEADGYIADPDQNVTGITVILPVDAMASFKLVFVHMDDATGELVWTDVPYTLENGILTFAVEEMGLFLFVAE